MSKSTREVWVADSETDPFLHGRFPAPFIWGTYNGDEYHEFKTTLEFVLFIQTKRCLVYAHNGGKFDWHFLLDQLEPYTDIQVISGRVSKFIIGEAEFRDSIDIIPVALAQYQKEEFDYGILEANVRDQGDNPQRISRYLKSDCVNLFDMVTTFHRDYGKSLTLAGAALKYWQKLDPDTPPPTSTGLHYSSVAPYYFGGRTELAKPGIINKPFDILDIKSAYPEAMMMQHPYGEIATISRELPSSAAKTQRALITVRCQSTGAFPLRGEGGGLTFPNDGVVRTFCVTGWEFLTAHELGLLRSMTVVSCVTFTGQVTFKVYVKHFFALKQYAEETGDMESRFFAKLFLTTLYGKLAANPDKYKEHCVIPPRYLEAAEDDDYRFCSQIGDLALVSRPIVEAKKRFLNVGTAASVTGFVRAKMMRAIHACGRHFIYCDTDSIFTHKIPATLKRQIGNNIGDWEHEGHALYGAFAGKKLYTVTLDDGKTKTASKGVRLSSRDIERVAEGDLVTYRAEAPSFSLSRGWHFVVRDVVMTGSAKVENITDASRDDVDFGDLDDSGELNYDK